MFHTHANEMMTYIFVWISVTRLKIHMMQCPRWFNGPTCAEQQQKFTVSLTEAVTASLTALLFQRRICVLVYVCVCFGGALCGRAQQLSVSNSLHSYKMYLSLSLFLSPICSPSFHWPSVRHFSSSTLPLWSLCLSLGPCLGHPSTPSLQACLHQVSGHASYLLTFTSLGWFIHPSSEAMRYVWGWAQPSWAQLDWSHAHT